MSVFCPLDVGYDSAYLGDDVASDSSWLACALRVIVNISVPVSSSPPQL